MVDSKYLKLLETRTNHHHQVLKTFGVGQKVKDQDFHQKNQYYPPTMPVMENPNVQTQILAMKSEAAKGQARKS